MKKVSTADLIRVLEIRYKYADADWRREYSEDSPFSEDNLRQSFDELGGNPSTQRKSAIEGIRDLDSWDNSDDSSYRDFCDEVLKETGIIYSLIVGSFQKVIDDTLKGNDIGNYRDYRIVLDYISDLAPEKQTPDDVGRLNAALTKFENAANS